MTSDSATNYAAALAECRRRLVRADRHRFALPGEPAPGWRRRARAQNAALAVAAAVLAAIVMVIE